MKYAAIATATTIIIIIVLCQHIPSLWHPFIGHVIAILFTSYMIVVIQ